MNQFVATEIDALATQDDLLSMSGLEFMQAVQDGRLSGPPIGKLMNFWLDTVGEGHIVFKGAPSFESLNPMRTTHGGWYGTLLDSCMSCAVMTMLPKGKIYTTLEFKVNIIRSIPTDLEVTGDGRVQHCGRSTAVANGEIRGAHDGKLYATGSATCLIMTPPLG